MEYLQKINIFNSEKCTLPYSGDCLGAYQLMFLVAMFCFVYYIFMKKYYGGDKQVAENDMMNRKVFECGVFENCCSMWPISHFIFFMILGFLYPKCWVPILILGASWELIEMGAGYLMDGGLQPMKTEKGNIEYSNNWWAGSSKDIVFNTAGFAVGAIIATLILKR